MTMDDVMKVIKLSFKTITNKCNIYSFKMTGIKCWAFIKTIKKNENINTELILCSHLNFSRKAILLVEYWNLKGKKQSKKRNNIYWESCQGTAFLYH